jgi:predicted esterase
MLPATPERVPAALLLHGLGSHKERMIDTVGAALLRLGVAALAVDLPLQGGREGAADDLRRVSPMQLLGSWSDAVAEARTSLDYLGTHAGIDASRLAIVGYSLGSFLANIVAADHPDVRAVVLAASGDLPDGIPFAPLVRSIVDPVRAVRALAGRPLLMVNGRYDRTVTAAQAEKLYAAAAEPKTLHWYDGGHWPPAREITFACEWLANQLQAADVRTPRTRASSAS